MSSSLIQQISPEPLLHLRQPLKIDAGAQSCPTELTDERDVHRCFPVRCTVEREVRSRGMTVALEMLSTELFILVGYLASGT